MRMGVKGVQFGLLSATIVWCRRNIYSDLMQTKANVLNEVVSNIETVNG